MSHNLILVRGKETNYAPFQTPTDVTEKLFFSKDTTAEYKKWVLHNVKSFDHVGHFRKIDALLCNGWEWRIN